MTASLRILRKIAEYQQYGELKAHCLAVEEQSGAVAALLALALAQLGERDGAEAALVRARAAGMDLDAWVDAAAACIALGHLPKAVEILEGALAERPEHPLALARLGYCRLLEDELDEARGLFEKAAALDGARIALPLYLVEVELRREAWAEAQRWLDEAAVRFAAARETLPEAVHQRYRHQLISLQLQLWVEGEQFARAEEWLEARRGEFDGEQWCELLIGYATLLAGRDRHEQAVEGLREGLKHYPESLALISQLAEFAQLQGRFMPSIQLLRRAIRLAKAQERPEAGLWVRLSSACLHRMDEQARQAAEKAVELAEAMEEGEESPPATVRQLRLQAKNALAQVESQEQNFETAEGLFREVLAEAPWFVPALQGLGHQQMQRGRIDEAVELFERIKRVDPAKGYSSLINVRRFPEDDETLERMELAARRPSLEGRVRSGILFQLASAWEKRGEYDKAFALAFDANEASRRFLPYDAKAHRNECARIRHAFCKALYEHRRECGVDSTLPVFVVGMPRSGTTLVEQILAGHSRIFGAGELGVIPSRIQGLNRWERHTGSGRRYPDCADDLTPYVTEGIANGVLDELKELAAEGKPGAEFVVDKLPHNFENIGFIKFLFPKAKIISVRRDPRDIALSNYFTDYQAKHGGMGFAYDLTAIGEQLADHNLLMHHWHRLFPGEILEIHYEEVVDDTEGAARRMLEYIGVAWEPRVLAFNELDRPVKTASVWQVRQPVYKSSKEKWRRYETHLAPLIRGTNAKIEWDPVEMLTLPEPGFLTEGVERYRKGDLDGAELSFKKMLHHNPEHAACNYMVGLVYLSKGHHRDGIERIERALKVAPWQREWRENLIKAYELVGEGEKAEALKKRPGAGRGETPAEEEEWDATAPFSGIEAV